MDVLVFLWVAVGTMLAICGLYDMYNSKSTPEDKRLGKYAIITGLFLPLVLVFVMGMFLYYVFRQSLVK